MDVDKVLDQRRVGQVKLEIYLDTDSSPTQTPGLIHLQIEAQVAYRLGFW